MAAWIALHALLVGVAGSLFSTEIRQQTIDILEGSCVGRTDWPVLLFWSAVILWLALFYVRLIAESDIHRRLRAAIYRCPNPRVLRQYDSFVKKISEVVGQQDTPETPDKASDVAAKLQAALKLICLLTKEFADSPSVELGANIMLVEAPCQDSLVSP